MTSAPSVFSSRRRERFQRPAAEAQRAGARFGALAGAVADAAQHRADARQQFARIERLGHVVVGAEFQADDPVGFLAHGG